jgi:predicted PurR-regulated permease PerM
MANENPSVSSPERRVALLPPALARPAVVGIFVILAGAVLYFAKALFLPIVAGLVLGIMFGRVSKKLEENTVPNWLAALLILLSCLVALSLVVTYLTAPVIEWVQTAPQLAEQLKSKLQFLERPLAMLDDFRTALSGQKNQPEVAIRGAQSELVQPVLEFLSPTITGFLLFVSTFYLFLAGRRSLRSSFVAFFPSHETRLRALKILNDIEYSLGTYFGLVTLINLAMGVLTAAACAIIGLPHPLTLGMLAFMFNYVPIIGPAATVCVLSAVGLVSFETLGQTAIAPLVFIGLATAEGHFITPMVIGRNLTLSAFTVLMSFAFWTWLWGPFGAFLANPLLIVALVAVEHLRARDEPDLPD